VGARASARCRASARDDVTRAIVVVVVVIVVCRASSSTTRV
jgi:hypothetical protein